MSNNDIDQYGARRHRHQLGKPFSALATGASHAISEQGRTGWIGGLERGEGLRRKESRRKSAVQKQNARSSADGPKTIGRHKGM